jgi:hypothetical protein
LRVLFFVHTANRLRNFEGLVEALAQRNHHVRLAVVDKGKLVLPPGLDSSSISIVVCPARRRDRWKAYARELRRLRDYLRYLAPEFRRARGLRKRSKEGANYIVSNVLTLVFRWPFTARYVVYADRCLQWIEDHIPSDPVMERFLRDEAPDVVLVTPLVQRGAEYQVDYIKSSHQLGLPVAVLPFSWDHLTNKGLMRVSPDRVFVWNEVQKREAVEFHHVPEQFVDICGGWRFDEFYAREPSMTRDEFCSATGLHPERPIVTYLCSSEFTAPEEEVFVLEWIRKIRSSFSPTLRDCGIVVRPYPDKARQWQDVQAGDGVFVMTGKQWQGPRMASWSNQSLYESLYHCDAAVGINTSAMIEAGILSKPVFTVVVDRFADGQSRTLHFEYLTRFAGGLAEVAADLDEHCAQLQQALAAGGTGRCARSDRFTQAFVRPGGLDRPVVPVVLDKIEALRGLQKAPRETLPEPTATEDRIYRTLGLLRWSFRHVHGRRPRRNERHAPQAGDHDGEVTRSDMMPAE